MRKTCETVVDWTTLGHGRRPVYTTPRKCRRAATAQTELAHAAPVRIASERTRVAFEIEISGCIGAC